MMLADLTTAGAVAASVLLLAPARDRLHLGRQPRPASPGLVLVVAAAVVVLVGGSSPRLVALGLIVTTAAFLGMRVLRVRRRRLAAAATSLRVLETCEQLAAELAAGQPPGAALQRAADDWATLAPVAQAFRVGADVPAAWREVATGDGARDLRIVGAAWQVAHRTGEGLADVVETVAHGLRAAHGTRRIVEGELASARATAKLVAGLPLLALAMGSGTGGDPWGFLLGRPLGLACLGAGLAFALCGLWWIELIARDVDRAS